MNSGKQFPIKFSQNPNSLSKKEREAILKKPGFGQKFTDHMLVIHYNDEKKWHDAEIKAYGPISLTRSQRKTFCQFGQKACHGPTS